MLSDKSSAHCDSSNSCDPGTTSGIRSAALVSDIGWIAGGVLLAGGAAIVLLAPRGSHDARVSLTVAPSVSSGGGGALLQGAW
jgi:hypothetical protein